MGAAMAFFERGYLKKNSTGLCHGSKFEVTTREQNGISREPVKPEPFPPCRIDIRLRKTVMAGTQLLSASRVENF